MPATPRRCCTRSPDRDERDSTSSPEPVPDRSCACRSTTTRPPGRFVASGWGCRASTSSRAWSRASRRASREAVAALEAAGAESRGRRRCRTPSTASPTYYIVAPAEASANLARYDGIRYGPRLGEGRDVLATTSRRAAAGSGAEVKRRIMLGTYALSAGYYDAYYLKAQKVRTLIKGDFDAPVGAGLRRARRRRPRRRSRSGSVRGSTIPWRCTSRMPARCP